ncbi:MAG TPA: DUF4032 domain-containing protein [Candidatus Aerophobetes bacterium]|uniref:DUF4032 domain-containing protein n=1 Tax=Aerophobetes bacterium TaxID=2030807 RepID=A0A7V5HYF1_UNCAE|nr:DUF4032 domain-containing protein [Candidatus Aerophobetes bacterium]
MILKERKPLKCFEKEAKKRNFSARIDRGIQTVEIDKIVGSVGRCMDFDANFSINNKSKTHILPRLERIKKAMMKGKSLPPVELYKLDEEYYVVDGHHRIAAAKDLGQKFIEAHVVEYLPSGSSSRDSLIRKRAEFELKTGLQNINLSQKDDYDKLLLQIEKHKEYLEKEKNQEVSLKEAAKDWFNSLYYPIVEKIKNYNLSEYFPDATPADIYVYLSDQVNTLKRKNGEYTVSLEKTLEELGILLKATKLILSEEGLKKKLLRLISPCFYLGKCPFEIEPEKID